MSHLNVYDPRVLQLQQAGESITTTSGQTTTKSGDLHRVGVYALAAGAAQ